ncbi:MAG: prolyl oligopeptidase family serine peptidase [Pseudonocardiaceae bacterium]
MRYDHGGPEGVQQTGVMASSPPPAARRESLDRIHGRLVPDPYRWLEQGNTPETRRWLDDQAKYFALHHQRWSHRDNLRNRIAELLDRPSWSVPAVFDHHLIATRSTGLVDYPELVVIEAGRVRTLVDPMRLDPSGLTRLDAWAPSLDGRLVAVQTSHRGTEHGQLVVLEVATGQVIDGPIGRLRSASVAWLPGNAGFYYVRMVDDPVDGRPVRRGVWLHMLGTDSGDDECVRPPTGPRPTVPFVRIDSEGRWLLVFESYGTNHRNDLWIADLPASDPAAPLLRPVQQGVDASTSGRLGPDGWLYLLTTLGAPRRRLCRARPEDPGSWQTVVPEDPHATLDEFAVLDDDAGRVEVVVTRTWAGRCELLAHDTAGHSPARSIAIPVKGVVQHLTATPGRGEMYLSIEGVTSPPSVYRFRGGSSLLEPWIQGQQIAANTPLNVTYTRYSAADGTLIGLTILQTPEHSPEPGPMILHAYGGHGSSRKLGYSASLLAWLEAGGRYAIAHVRGGGDEGRSWHHAGTRTGKLTTITDVVAAARWLSEQGYSRPEQLCLSGGSQGGLVVLAAAVREPSICGAVIAHAPLADMVRFEQMGLGASWTEEFGTVADPSEFEALLCYSPYHNVVEGAPYPAVLLTGFHEDSRTGAAHPRKMCAALQWANHGERPVLLRYAFDAGHARAALSRAIDLAADVHAFAAAWTGLDPATVDHRSEREEVRHG